jgi:hypothetical protein
MALEQIRAVWNLLPGAPKGRDVKARGSAPGPVRPHCLPLSLWDLSASGGEGEGGEGHCRGGVTFALTKR